MISATVPSACYGQSRTAIYFDIETLYEILLVHSSENTVESGLKSRRPESLIAHSRRLQFCELTHRPAKISGFSLGLLHWCPSVRFDSFTDWLVITIVTDRSTELDVDDPVLNQVDDSLNLAQSLNDAVYGCRTTSSTSPVITCCRPALSARSRLEP